MKKIIRRLMICGWITVIIWGCILLTEKRELREGLIRFHVVAHSDGAEDQKIKEYVRDVVLESMEKDLTALKNVEEAKAYLQDNIPKLKILVDQTLEDLGFQGPSRISLCKESFDVRHYDTFSLPAGVYESLRIVIGDGAGKNWWCVSFPTLCIPATSSGFTDRAVSAGFSESLAQTLSAEDSYEIRFFFLNQLGKLENIFSRNKLSLLFGQIL